VRLFEHPDFDQAILQTAERFQLRPAIIEKDYYVTEALRIIAAAAGDKVIFKGGTSLSKGWNLIQRFSEDIDIFLDPLAFAPPPDQTRHRPRTEELTRCGGRASGPPVCPRGESNHRRVRAQ
jgi:Nucleotidyl transferase AbiEii toxin, Type IV TA system